MQDIGYVVTITIGKCLGAVTGVGDAFSVFQRDVNGVISESEEDIFSSEGIVWRTTLSTSDVKEVVVQQK